MTETNLIIGFTVGAAVMLGLIIWSLVKVYSVSGDVNSTIVNPSDNGGNGTSDVHDRWSSTLVWTKSDTTVEARDIDITGENTVYFPTKSSGTELITPKLIESIGEGGVSPFTLSGPVDNKRSFGVQFVTPGYYKISVDFNGSSFANPRQFEFFLFNVDDGAAGPRLAITPPSTNRIAMNGSATLLLGDDEPNGIVSNTLYSLSMINVDGSVVVDVVMSGASFSVEYMGRPNASL